MPRLGTFKTTNTLALALEIAQRAKLPILITYKIPQDRIENPVVNLTVEDKLVYLALDPEDADIQAKLARFQLKKFRATLVDQHGNVLKSRLRTSIEMLEAFEQLSDLRDASRTRFEQSHEEGRRLLEAGDTKRALRVLEVFAFARGFPQAEEGKALFETAAEAARSAYLDLLTNAPERTAEQQRREAWVKTLRRFSREWRGSPAALAAKQEAREWKARLQVD